MKKQEPTSFDIHHLMYIEEEWNKKDGRVLRESSYCKVVIPRDLHEAIHAKVKKVPVPSRSSREYVLEQMGWLSLFRFISDEDPITKRLETLISLFEEIDEEPTVTALRRQLEAVKTYKKKKGPS